MSHCHLEASLPSLYCPDTPLRHAFFSWSRKCGLSKQKRLATFSVDKHSFSNAGNGLRVRPNRLLPSRPIRPATPCTKNKRERLLQAPVTVHFFYRSVQKWKCGTNALATFNWGRKERDIPVYTRDNVGWLREKQRRQSRWGVSKFSPRRVSKTARHESHGCRVRCASAPGRPRVKP